MLALPVSSTRHSPSPLPSSSTPFISLSLETKQENKTTTTTLIKKKCQAKERKEEGQRECTSGETCSCKHTHVYTTKSHENGKA